MLLVSMLIYACNADQQLAEGGIEGTGRTIGPISGFGSVYVNGIKFDTSNTSFTFEGKPGSQDQLFQGMIITASGDTTEPDSVGSANNVDFRFNLIGAVDHVEEEDKLANSLKAVGQVVLLNELTVLRNASGLDDFADDDIVAVSGFRRANGQIVATYIEKVDSGDPASLNATVLEGKVQAIDHRLFTFRIGDQLVGYASAQLDLPAGGLEDGLFVRVNGRESGEQLTAFSIEDPQSGLETSDIDYASVSGLVTSVGTEAFTLNDTSVIVTPATSLKNGDRSDIVVNASLLVRGLRNSEGELLAIEIIFSSQPNISVEASVEGVDPESKTVTLAGLTAIVNSFTLMLDSSPAGLPAFSVDDIAIGDRLTISGVEHGSRTVVTSRLERKIRLAADTPALIEGAADTPSGNTVFPIAGLPIDTTSLQDFTGFFEGDVIPISRDKFFSSLQAGDRVRVSGFPTSESLQATRVALLNLGNLSVLDSAGVVFGGTNDLVAVWDGTLNTQMDILNNTLQENMTITSASGFPFFGFPMTFHDIHVFEPGIYSFDTCQDDSSGSCQIPRIINFTIGPDQLGAHMLFDWNISTNIDLAVVWDVGGSFPYEQLYLGPAGTTPSQLAIWNLVSVDADGDGFPGIALVDGPFIGFSWNLNLNLSSMPAR
jgi:hypothetical protein